MTTSGSSDYTETRDQIISDSLQLLGVVGAGETPSSADITFAANILNKMIKGWQAQGIHLWKETNQIVTIVAGQASYDLSPRPLNVISCLYSYGTGLDRKMKKLGRSEYESLPTKTTSTGPSTAFYYSPQLSTGTLYVWPVPTSTEVTNSDTFTVTYMKTIEDFDASGDTPDFPQEWLECLTYNLAVRLAPAYGIVLQTRKITSEVLTIATQSLQEIQAWDSEEGSIKINPNYRYD